MDDNNFLGQGWAFPPAFVKGTVNTVILSCEDDNIQENLRVLFATRIGERLLEFGYGSQLMSLAFGKRDDVLIGQIEDTVKRAILLHEPRIKVDEVLVNFPETDRNKAEVQVRYLIKKINDRSNFVFPFHLTEGTNLYL